MARMDTLTSPADQGRPSTEAGQPMTASDGVNRRALLRGAGGGLVAAGVAACAPAAVGRATQLG
jgi:hypothetical protein